MSEVRKAVIPAAGWGTRFLPFTKAVPKELLPLGTRPAIELVVAEAQAAGISELAVITRPGKEAIAEHFSPAPELETFLKATHKENLLPATYDSRFYFVHQPQMLGLGHAVAQARAVVGRETFAVMLPDDLFGTEDPLLQRMIQVQAALGGSVVALIPVTPQEAAAYGSPRVREVPIPASVDAPPGTLLELTDMVEKPTLAEVRSGWAMVGRYVFDPVIFDVLDQTEPGLNNEIQLTDAINTLSTIPRDKGGGVWGLVAQGRRFDTGNPLGYLQAVVSYGCEDPALKDDFTAWLKTFQTGRINA